MEFSQLLDTLAEVRTQYPDEFDTPFINALSMREFGNKTHGDMLEIAFEELLNSQLFPNISARHVGKERYRADGAEEDVLVWFLDTPGDTLNVSLKAYGSGDLQLATNSDASMRNLLAELVGDNENVSEITDIEIIQTILERDPFTNFLEETNTIAAIYTETELGVAELRELADFDTQEMRKRELQARLIVQGAEPLNRSFQIMSFNAVEAFASVVRIAYEIPNVGRGTPRPRWRFYDADGTRIMEVRYGAAGANALQRGLWTHTVNAVAYFRIVTLETEFEVASNFLAATRKLLLLKNEELE